MRFVLFLLALFLLALVVALAQEDGKPTRVHIQKQFSQPLQDIFKPGHGTVIACFPDRASSDFPLCTSFLAGTSVLYRVNKIPVSGEQCNSYGTGAFVVDPKGYFYSCSIQLDRSFDPPKAFEPMRLIWLRSAMPVMVESW